MDAMQQQAMHIANDARRQQRHTALLAALKLLDLGIMVIANNVTR